MLESELYNAAKNNDLAEVKRLLDLGAGCGCFSVKPDISTSVLIECVTQTDVIRMILNKYPTVDLNIVSSLDITPASAAAIYNFDVLKLYYTHGAKLNTVNVFESLKSITDSNVMKFIANKISFTDYRGDSISIIARAWHSGESVKMMNCLLEHDLPFRLRYQALLATLDELSVNFEFMDSKRGKSRKTNLTEMFKTIYATFNLTELSAICAYPALVGSGHPEFMHQLFEVIRANEDNLDQLEKTYRYSEYSDKQTILRLSIFGNLRNRESANSGFISAYQRP